MKPCRAGREPVSWLDALRGEQFGSRGMKLVSIISAVGQCVAWDANTAAEVANRNTAGSKLEEKKLINELTFA